MKFVWGIAPILKNFFSFDSLHISDDVHFSEVLNFVCMNQEFMLSCLSGGSFFKVFWGLSLSGHFGSNFGGVILEGHFGVSFWGVVFGGHFGWVVSGGHFGESFWYFSILFNTFGYYLGTFWYSLVLFSTFQYFLVLFGTFLYCLGGSKYFGEQNAWECQNFWGVKILRGKHLNLNLTSPKILHPQILTPKTFDPSKILTPQKFETPKHFDPLKNLTPPKVWTNKKKIIHKQDVTQPPTKNLILINFDPH